MCRHTIIFYLFVILAINSSIVCKKIRHENFSEVQYALGFGMKYLATGDKRVKDGDGGELLLLH